MDHDVSMAAHGSWEREASNWIAWARTPGHDVFGYYSPAFFEEIVPRPRGLTLEIGSGEGRVARELAARGHHVVGLDASPTLVRHARDADPASAYLIADATSPPFADGTFHTVVAYNSLQTLAMMEDMARAVREAARVLRPSGHFCLCVAHPMTDVGRLEESPGGGGLVITESYFERRRVNETVSKDGLEMTFHGWTYSLEDYTRALEEAGFLIECAREPAPRGGRAAEERSLDRWRRVPLFLFVRAVNAAG